MPRRLAVALLVVAIPGSIALYRRRPPATAPRREAVAEPDRWTPEPPLAPDRRPPRAGEVVAAIARVFAGALPADALEIHRALAGDFNGDGSADLVVPARPVDAHRGALSSETANWILVDPADADAGAVRVETGDSLLALVHGVGRAGWRDGAARQGYVLKLERRRTFEVVPTGESERETLRVRGDLLMDGAGQFLYWTGARYRWHWGDEVPPVRASASGAPRR
jgi:hypothetical protein